MSQQAENPGLQLANAQKQAVEQLDFLTAELSRYRPSVAERTDLEPIVRALALTTRLLTFHAASPPVDNPSSISTFELAEAITALDRSRETILPSGPAEPLVKALFESVKLLTALAATNECQMALPYAPMQRVRKPDGQVVWQCSHEPMHES
ncbi:hypothetical protein [Mesorhizobium sp.]|jgi:hypothetical protein|uniref:hypothetical protein n=1 Tax=Mesorhizobium sp. TaxID=1871066 RepID=UPI0035627396